MENLELKINVALETNWAKTENKPEWVNEWMNEWMKHIRKLQTKKLCEILWNIIV